MNKHGQTLVFFVILIPLFVMLLAFIVDTGLLLKENTKLIGTTKTIINRVYDQRFDENINDIIKDLYEKNDIPSKNLKIDITNDQLIIMNEYSINSMFGQIIGLKKYDVKIKIKGYLKEDKIIFEKE